MGKFHGQMRPTTPTASRVIVTSTLGRTDATCVPSMRKASCAKNLKICAARVVSAMPLAKGLPSSRERMRPISSLRARSSVPIISNASARCCGVESPQPTLADLAAAMASSVCALLACVNSPTTSLMSEGLMSTVTPTPSTQAPAIKFCFAAMFKFPV